MKQSNKITCISHIYNEEYLLPFWLEHHSKIFDQIIIIDYKSTDKSIEICKKICPNCIIITTRNLTDDDMPNFDAILIDNEVHDIERSIEGIKIVLNTTEFLFFSISIKELFDELDSYQSYTIPVITPYSNKIYNIENNYELYLNLLKKDVVYHYDRGIRVIHNYPYGKYTVGRHNTLNPSVFIDKLHIFWFGYYPLNEFLLNRKLQIQNNIPLRDKQMGNGKEHLYTKETILLVNEHKVSSGNLLENINIPLINLLILKIENLLKLNNKKFNIEENDIFSENIHLQNIINNRINLIKNNDGYKIINIGNYSNLLELFFYNELKFFTNKHIDIVNYHNEITIDENKNFINTFPYKKNMYNDILEFFNNIEEHISTILCEPLRILNDDLIFEIYKPGDEFNSTFIDNSIIVYFPIFNLNDNFLIEINQGSHLWSKNDLIISSFINYINEKYFLNKIIETNKINIKKDEIILTSSHLIYNFSNNTDKTYILLKIILIRK
jgi:hypothetical protein